mmetsp:Transcript_26002/g.65117  ORF Transcript_26002/g.65117 Transcript_26002/m.65117 type:complete len:282 (-) Transcript_26002:720-1565(-)
MARTRRGGCCGGRCAVAAAGSERGKAPPARGGHGAAVHRRQHARHQGCDAGDDGAARGRRRDGGPRGHGFQRVQNPDGGSQRHPGPGVSDHPARRHGQGAAQRGVAAGRPQRRTDGGRLARTGGGARLCPHGGGGCGASVGRADGGDAPRDGGNAWAGQRHRLHRPRAWKDGGATAEQGDGGGENHHTVLDLLQGPRQQCRGHSRTQETSQGHHQGAQHVGGQSEPTGAAALPHSQARHRGHGGGSAEHPGRRPCVGHAAGAPRVARAAGSGRRRRQLAGG